MLSWRSALNPCCGPNTAASLVPGADAARSTTWRNAPSTEAGLATTPTRRPRSAPESNRRSDPSVTFMVSGGSRIRRPVGPARRGRRRAGRAVRLLLETRQRLRSAPAPQLVAEFLERHPHNVAMVDVQPDGADRVEPQAVNQVEVVERQRRRVRSEVERLDLA